jgi:hypothetical protein
VPEEPLEPSEPDVPEVPDEPLDPDVPDAPSFVPTTPEGFIVNTVPSVGCPCKSLRLIPAKSAIDPLTIIFFQSAIYTIFLFYYTYMILS